MASCFDVRDSIVEMRSGLVHMAGLQSNGQFIFCAFLCIFTNNIHGIKLLYIIIKRGHCSITPLLLLASGNISTWHFGQSLTSAGSCFFSLFVLLSTNMLCISC